MRSPAAAVGGRAQGASGHDRGAHRARRGGRGLCSARPLLEGHLYPHPLPRYRRGPRLRRRDERPAPDGGRRVSRERCAHDGRALRPAARGGAASAPAGGQPLAGCCAVHGRCALGAPCPLRQPVSGSVRRTASIASMLRRGSFSCLRRSRTAQPSRSKVFSRFRNVWKTRNVSLLWAFLTASTSVTPRLCAARSRVPRDGRHPHGDEL